MLVSKIANENTMGNFSINDLSELSGLKKHTIRVWEQRYSFLKPRRQESQHRSYTAEELGVLLDAALLNHHGYRVSLIDKMTQEKKRHAFSRMADGREKAVHELIIQMARMDSDGFENALQAAVQTWGIHSTLQQQLLPFCERIGLLEGSYNKNYTENIILVRQSIVHKLVMGIGQANPGYSRNKTVLLFHAAPAAEIPLLYVQYMLVMNGFRVLHIGQQPAIENLAGICGKLHPDFIVGYPAKGGSVVRSLEQFVAGLKKNTLFFSIEQPLALQHGCAHYACFPNAEKFLEMILEKQPAPAY